MKRYFYIIVVLFLMFINSSVNAKGIDIKSKEAILYNLNDNSIIYEKNSNNITYIASLTKIATALVSIENIDNLDSYVIVKNSDLVGLNGYAKAGFKSGDKVTYRDLLYGLLLPSGADAALILANNMSGNVDNFVNLMNKKVKQLNLKNTKFSNPVGMDANNVSTASDIAIILKEALKNQSFKTIFESNEYTTSNNLNLKKTTFSTSLRNNIDISFITGSKTGYTLKASYCLASTANINGVSYLLVTLNNPNKIGHIIDSLGIYNYYSSNYSYKQIVTKGKIITSIKVKHSKTKKYNIRASKTIKKYLSNDIDLNEIEYKYDGINTLNRKIKKGDCLGIVTILYKEKKLSSFKVYLSSDIKYYNYWLLLILLIPVVIVYLKYISIKKKKKKKKKVRKFLD